MGLPFKPIVLSLPVPHSCSHTPQWRQTVVASSLSPAAPPLPSQLVLSSPPARADAPRLALDRQYYGSHFPCHSCRPADITSTADPSLGLHTCDVHYLDVTGGNFHTSCTGRPGFAPSSSRMVHENRTKFEPCWTESQLPFL